MRGTDHRLDRSRRFDGVGRFGVGPRGGQKFQRRTRRLRPRWHQLTGTSGTGSDTDGGHAGEVTGRRRGHASEGVQDRPLHFEGLHGERGGDLQSGQVHGQARDLLPRQSPAAAGIQPWAIGWGSLAVWVRLPASTPVGRPLDLAENRAQAVAAYLKGRGLSCTVDTEPDTTVTTRFAN